MNALNELLEKAFTTESILDCKRFEIAAKKVGIKLPRNDGETAEWLIRCLECLEEPAPAPAVAAKVPAKKGKAIVVVEPDEPDEPIEPEEPEEPDEIDNPFTACVDVAELKKARDALGLKCNWTIAKYPTLEDFADTLFALYCESEGLEMPAPPPPKKGKESTIEVSPFGARCGTDLYDIDILLGQFLSVAERGKQLSELRTAKNSSVRSSVRDSRYDISQRLSKLVNNRIGGAADPVRVQILRKGALFKIGRIY